MPVQRLRILHSMGYDFKDMTRYSTRRHGRRGYEAENIRFVAHFTPQNVVVFVDMDVTESYNFSILFSLLGRLTEGLS